jgi:hypothetical protein
VTDLTDLKEALSLKERFVVCAGPASLTPWVLLPSPRPAPPAPPLLPFLPLPSLRFLPLGRTWTWTWVVSLRPWGRQKQYILMLVTLFTVHNQTDIFTVENKKKSKAKKAKNTPGGGKY